MKSKTLGGNTSEVEVTNVSRHGLWLWVKGKEYFLSYEDYPWFKGAKNSDALNVELHRGGHLHWSRLDVDLEVSMLEEPDRYPLIARRA